MFGSRAQRRISFDTRVGSVRRMSPSCRPAMHRRSPTAPRRRSFPRTLERTPSSDTQQNFAGQSVPRPRNVLRGSWRLARASARRAPTPRGQCVRRKDLSPEDLLFGSRDAAEWHRRLHVGLHSWSFDRIRGLFERRADLDYKWMRHSGSGMLPFSGILTPFRPKGAGGLYSSGRIRTCAH